MARNWAHHGRICACWQPVARAMTKGPHQGLSMHSKLNDLLEQLVLRGWAKVDLPAGVSKVPPDAPWWSIDLGAGLGAVTTVSLHPWPGGLLEFSLCVLIDAEDRIQSYELECNAMPVPVALINWWGGLESALLQAETLKDELIAAWDQEISAGGEWP